MLDELTLLMLENQELKKRNVLRIIHWNSGAKHWPKQRDEINDLIRDYSPDILYVSEANLYRGTADYETQINGYELIPSPTMERHGYSRLQLLVREGITMKTHKNLEHGDIASIWGTVELEGQKNIKIGGIYREHAILLQPDTDATQDRNRSRTEDGTSL